MNEIAYIVYFTIVAELIGAHDDRIPTSEERCFLDRPRDFERLGMKVAWAIITSGTDRMEEREREEDSRRNRISLSESSLLLRPAGGTRFRGK